MRDRVGIGPLGLIAALLGATRPHDGTNPTLALVARTYGVLKGPAGDPPHWSDDGH